jgi:hypothetical protein
MTQYNTSTHNRKLEDRITTGLGLTAAVAGYLNQSGHYPNTTGFIAAIAVAALGFFTNKPLK